MRVRLEFPTKKAKVIADGKDLGLFSNSVEVDARRIELVEYEFQGNKPLESDPRDESPREAPAREERVFGAAGGGSGGFVGVAGSKQTPQRQDAGNSEKRFVVTGGEEGESAE